MTTNDFIHELYLIQDYSIGRNRNWELHINSLCEKFVHECSDCDTALWYQHYDRLMTRINDRLIAAYKQKSAVVPA